MKTVHIVIKGKVQGVFFRASAKEIAERLGLVGWVKNTRQGDVEALITGSKEAVAQFIGWCKKGPSRAHVSEVVTAEKDLENFSSFTIIR